MHSMSPRFWILLLFATITVSVHASISATSVTFRPNHNETLCTSSTGNRECCLSSSIHCLVTDEFLIVECIKGSDRLNTSRISLNCNDDDSLNTKFDKCQLILMNEYLTQDQCKIIEEYHLDLICLLIGGGTTLLTFPFLPAGMFASLITCAPLIYVRSYP